jgi:DNA-binding NarL/FixJ family response regulator
LAEVAARGPFVVAIDDLHTADDATLVAVRNLSEELAAYPILWLLTLAPGRADPTAQMLVARGATAIRLGSLSRHAVSELARDILGGVPSDAVLDFVGDLADRPALIVELLQACVAERLVEVADGRARLTGLGLYRAVSELRRHSDRHAPELEAALRLTRSELAVVELVARGATNRQAAERLFLSPHTVSTHLRNTFEKLGIRSRVELAVMFAQGQAEGASTVSRAHAAGSGGLAPV